jgi:hypothetical protein
MFSNPAYYVGGKLFTCVYENAVALKVPEAMSKKVLKLDDIVYFQPLGRKKMRECIQINKEKLDDYLLEKKVFDASIEFVSSIAGLNIKKTK